MGRRNIKPSNAGGTSDINSGKSKYKTNHRKQTKIQNITERLYKGIKPKQRHEIRYQTNLDNTSTRKKFITAERSHSREWIGKQNLSSGSHSGSEDGVWVSMN